MRDLARSLVVGSLQKEQSVGSDRKGDSRVTTVRHETLEGYPAERYKANGEWYM
jgi:hypothetical protein